MEIKSRIENDTHSIERAFRSLNQRGFGNDSNVPCTFAAMNKSAPLTIYVYIYIRELLWMNRDSFDLPSCRVSNAFMFYCQINTLLPTFYYYYFILKEIEVISVNGSRFYFILCCDRGVISYCL